MGKHVLTAAGYRVMAVGDKWGRLRLDGIESRETESTNLSGITTWGDEDFLTMACDCGKVFEIPASEFRGKSAFKDCGCGLSAGDGPTTMSSFSLPLGLRNRIDAWAKEHTGGNRSKAVQKLIQTGLEVLGKVGGGG